VVVGDATLGTTPVLVGLLYSYVINLSAPKALPELKYVKNIGGVGLAAPERPAPHRNKNLGLLLLINPSKNAFFKHG